jgi:hypothetical protein
LLAFKLYRFPFVQGTVSILLDSRKVDEDILSRRPLNEPVSLCSVEPLHDTTFPHVNSSLNFLHSFLKSAQKHDEPPLRIEKKYATAALENSEYAEELGYQYIKNGLLRKRSR